MPTCASGWSRSFVSKSRTSLVPRPAPSSSYIPRESTGNAEPARTGQRRGCGQLDRSLRHQVGRSVRDDETWVVRKDRSINASSDRPFSIGETARSSNWSAPLILSVTIQRLKSESLVASTANVRLYSWTFVTSWSASLLGSLERSGPSTSSQNSVRSSSTAAPAGTICSAARLEQHRWRTDLSLSDPWRWCLTIICVRPTAGVCRLATAQVRLPASSRWAGSVWSTVIRDA